MNTFKKDTESVSDVETVSEVSKVSEPVLTEQPVLKPLGANRRNTRGGRPKKSEIEKRLRKDPTRGRGRPPGEAQKIKELMARMLLTNGENVLQKTINIALDDNHQHQMAAIKLLMDRALPTSFFENKDSNAGSGSGIVINISGLTPKIESSNDVIDVEVDDESR
jgi:hypothetical protein